MVTARLGVDRLVADGYRWLFGRASTQRLNEFVLHLALSSRGYNNWQTLELSGERRFIGWLSERSPRLCLDVGANVGDYSQLLLSRTAAEVVAFEPLPQSFAKLAALGARFPGRLTAHNVGVGAREAMLDLYFGASDTKLATFSAEVNSIAYVGEENSSRTSVRVTTIDAYLAERDLPEIDLLKIDTEGFEFEVLTGAAETIANRPPKFVQIEYNHHQLFRNHSLLTLARLLPGYGVFQLLPGTRGMVRRDPALHENNVYAFTNFVFVRDDIAAGRQAL